MDMDKCVRCGNCSMACHQVHGQSRLLRRGIHIERPKNYGGVSGEKLLVPSVCMHCQDPECLTGCPTGAIGRFGNGQIDIDPKTCIGCGDCATQCPYNAITMIPRKPEVPKPPTFAGRLKGWLSLAPHKPPQPVTATENLLATKCNLCAGTKLNPPGARTQAFSCQENCPTGALVRVNPREHFAEVNGRIGLVFRDQTHAIGRNIHRRDPLALFWHVFGVLLVVGLTAGVVWALTRFGIDERLGGTWLTVRWVTGLLGLGGVAAEAGLPQARGSFALLDAGARLRGAGGGARAFAARRKDDGRAADVAFDGLVRRRHRNGAVRHPRLPRRTARDDEHRGRAPVDRRPARAA
jgi:Fe-S-cluster-containing dehydrogenase component